MSQLPPGFQLDGPPAPAAAPQGGPTLRPVLTLPDPKGDRAEQRDETRLDSTLQGDQRAASKDQFDRITTYRKEFLTEPLVREFRGVQNATNQIIELAKRENDQPGPGDIALIISFMKALDPGSVVRETEFATAENAGGVPETVRNAYNKLLNGGRLTPEIKKEFASTATAFYNSRLSGYNAFAEDYRGLVSAEGADPDAQGIRLAEPMSFGGGRGTGLQTAPVTVEQSAALFGQPRFDEQGNPVGEGYQGPTFNADGTPGPFMGSGDGPIQDPRDQMGFLEGIGETLTGSERSTPEIEALPDWTTMPAPGMAGFLASLGSMVSGPEETAQILQAQGLATRVRQDAKGNFILTGQDGKEYAIKPGFRMSDVPRAAGALLAFTPAGRATTIAGGAAGAAGTQAVIEGSQAATGGNFDTSDVVLAGAGGAAAPLAGRGIQAFRGRGGGAGGGGSPVTPTTPGGEVIQAADNFNTATGANVQPIAADVAGPITRRASGALAQTTFGAKPIIEGAQAVNDQAQAGIRTLAGRQGAVPQSRQAGGEVAMKGADKTMQRAKLKVDALYTKARKAAGDATLDLPMAQATLQKHIDELSQVPGGGEGLSTLKALSDDIAGRRFPVDGIKAMRTQLRDKFLKDGLRGSDVERRVNEVVDAAELDIEDGLLALGKRDAAQLYADASKAAAERFSLIDDVLAPVLGRNGEKSGEQVFAAIDQLSRGDAVSLGKFMRALPEEEAGSIRGLLIDRLGRTTKGRQDADGQAFSLNDFLTRWNDEGLSREAKGVLFDGETIAALDDLARVAQGTKEGQRFANFSNTGGVTWFNALLNGAPLGAAIGGVVPAAAAAGTSVTAQLGLGKLLGNPGFARWLAKMPKQPNAVAVRKHVEGLEKIAKANPAISADITDFQARLRAALPAGGGQSPVGVQSQQGAFSSAAQSQSEDSNTTGSGTQ